MSTPSATDTRSQGDSGEDDRILIAGCSPQRRGGGGGTSGRDRLNLTEREPLLGHCRDMAATQEPAVAPPPAEHGADDALAKRVIRKIDRTIVPLLFITYMFNFMDKVILSSAAVFGLRDDNVSHGSHTTHHQL